MLKLISFLLTTSALFVHFYHVTSQATELGEVKDCQPCEFQIAPQQHKILLFFIADKRPSEGIRLRKIEVKKQDVAQNLQTLDVSDMEPIGPHDSFFILAKDINFDGLNDLVLRTSEGGANSYADYWIFDGAMGQFKFLGNYPWLKIDPNRKLLSTYERGGHGGLIYEAKEYAFIEGQLVLVKSVSQKQNEKGEGYQRVTKELKDNRLVITRHENVRAPSH